MPCHCSILPILRLNQNLLYRRKAMRASFHYFFEFINQKSALGLVFRCFYDGRLSGSRKPPFEHFNSHVSLLGVVALGVDDEVVIRQPKIDSVGDRPDGGPIVQEPRLQGVALLPLETDAGHFQQTVHKHLQTAVKQNSVRLHLVGIFDLSVFRQQRVTHLSELG
nr:MAG TPA: hypothetical protein [Caudoviricetes sp.]